MHFKNGDDKKSKQTIKYKTNEKPPLESRNKTHSTSLENHLKRY